MISMENVHRTFAVLEVDDGYLIVNTQRNGNDDRRVRVTSHTSGSTIFEALVKFLGTDPKVYNEEQSLVS